MTYKKADFRSLINPVVTVLTEDPEAHAFAKAYWTTDAKYKWVEKSTHLEETFKLKKGSVHQFAEAICYIRTPDIRCHRCSEALLFRRRTAYQEFVDNFRYNESDIFRFNHTCGDCAALIREETRKKEDEKKRLELQIIVEYIHSTNTQAPDFDNQTHSPLDAFMLACLISGRENDPKFGNPGLIGYGYEVAKKMNLHKDEAWDLLSRLHSSGIIVPTPRNEVNCFCVEDGMPKVISPRFVEWMIPGIDDELSLKEVTSAVWQRFRSSSIDELREIWQWVCLAELRSHISYCESHFHCGVMGYTPSLRSAILEVSEEHPIPKVKTIIWSAFKYLKGMRPSSNTRIPPRNLLPNKIINTVEIYRKNDWEVYDWSGENEKNSTFMNMFFSGFGLNSRASEGYMLFRGSHLD